MNLFGSSLSLSAQDPSRNQSWEGSSCPGEASQECEGFTDRHLSLSVPCSVPLEAMCSGKLQTGLLVAGYFVYLLVGAAVFQALERTAEKQEKMAAAQMKEAFLQTFTQLTKKIKFLTLLFFLATGILVFLCLPSVFFQITEGWSYSEGIYFAFITLSTIGFGDNVVGKQSDRKYFSYYRVLVAIWILFGLAWIALLFNLLTTVLEDTEKIIVKDLQQIGKGVKDIRTVVTGA
ncbi:potassium channel subfamily K member 10-like isoform X3 [Willisornis vidua]|uniref:Potassium channel subfamily K member 10-like isoform X3 n=1 Tax=Willisornis vidua TaxID=1566151 RepID=A0ABQ9D7T9_9PASS|nr:potassium channel subfamily K member 10-like isoform X3 [Willisornis vidua]